MDVQERLQVTLGERVVEIQSEGRGREATVRLAIGGGEVALTREEWAEVHRSLGRMLAPPVLTPPSEAAAAGPGRRGQPWEDTEDEQLREGWSDGATVAQLAKEHERSRGAIRARLLRLGIVASKPELVVANRERRARGEQG